MRAGEVHHDATALESLQGLAVQGIGGRTLAQERARAGQGAKSPVRAGGMGSFLELPEGRSGRIVGAASDGRLDQLDQGPTEEAKILMLACLLGARERDLVAAEAIVEHRGRIPG